MILAYTLTDPLPSLPLGAQDRLLLNALMVRADRAPPGRTRHLVSLRLLIAATGWTRRGVTQRMDRLARLGLITLLRTD